MFGFGFNQRINKDFDTSQLGPKTKEILEKYSINPVDHTVFSGILQYDEIERNYPLTIQERVDLHIEQLDFLYKLQDGEQEMRSSVKNLVNNPYFKYHISLSSIPEYFDMLSKKRKEDIDLIKSNLKNLEDLLWEDENFISKLTK